MLQCGFGSVFVETSVSFVFFKNLYEWIVAQIFSLEDLISSKNDIKSCFVKPQDSAQWIFVVVFLESIGHDSILQKMEVIMLIYGCIVQLFQAFLFPLHLFCCWQ